MVGEGRNNLVHLAPEDCKPHPQHRTRNCWPATVDAPSAETIKFMNALINLNQRIVR